MKDWWQREWEQIQSQLRANPRLRICLLCIPLIAIFYFNLLLSDSRGEAHAALATLQEELLDAQRLSRQGEWVARVDQARKHLNEQAGQLFGKADSEAFARADIQASAKAMLEAQRLQQIRVEVSTAGKPDPQTQLIPIQLRLSGSAQGEQLFNLIATMEHARPRYRVDSLSVQSENGKSLLFSLIASVWYQPWEMR